MIVFLFYLVAILLIFTAVAAIADLWLWLHPEEEE